MVSIISGKYKEKQSKRMGVIKEKDYCREGGQGRHFNGNNVLAETWETQLWKLFEDLRKSLYEKEQVQRSLVRNALDAFEKEED